MPWTTTRKPAEAARDDAERRPSRAETPEGSPRRIASASIAPLRAR